MTAIRRLTFEWLTADLYRKISACFAALMIYQWIRCLGDYWWSETFTIVNGILLAAALANVLIPSKSLSIGVQLIAIAGLNAAYTDFQWLPFEGSRRSAMDWFDWIGNQFGELNPFIWISLGVLAVFHLIVLLRNKRIYILLLTGAAVLSLAVADSIFTPIYLWEEIAWIVFIGLGWLVASHFAGFKRRHPENWAQLLEYPLSLFLPILLILTLVMAAGLFVPTVKPVLTDPYTAWKESRGEAVPSFVGDKAIMVAAGKNDADTRSGYSRNDSVLGGGFTFDYTPVMEVTTNLRSYWRGETRALYNGTGWLESPEEKAEAAEPNIGGQALPANGLPASTKTEVVEQSITMVRKDKFPVLFGAGPISKVTMINDGADTFPSMSWLPDSWELRLSKSASVKYPATYAVQSNVPVLDEKALRAGAAATPASDMSAIYLQLPARLPDRVRTLAQQLTRDAATPYDKVRALIGYLQLNYTYTNTPDLSRKSSKDFVDAFLFEIKEGYCDYFSTSLAVMTRSLGIPARWVKGYSSGSLPGNPSLDQLQGMPGGINPNPDGSGTYTVRNADAHSWVEVYFNGYGWLPFEATPGFSYPYALPKDEPEPVTKVDPADTGTTDLEPAADDGGFDVKPWMFWAAAGALALALAVYGYRAFPALLRRYRSGGDSVNSRIVYETNRLIKHCRKKGLDVQKNETVRETMGRWSNRLTSLQPQFNAVQNAFEKAMYSSRSMTEEEADRVSATMKQIREHLG